MRYNRIYLVIQFQLLMRQVLSFDVLIQHLFTFIRSLHKRIVELFDWMRLLSHFSVYYFLFWNKTLSFKNRHEIYTKSSFIVVVIILVKGDYNGLTRKRDICRFVEEDFLYPTPYVLSNSVVHRERKSIYGPFQISHEGPYSIDDRQFS
jgi:hypothetical protein